MSAGAEDEESRSIRVLRLAWQRDVAELQRQLVRVWLRRPRPGQASPSCEQREASTRADTLDDESKAESRRWLAREVRWRRELARIHSESEEALAQERAARERAERDVRAGTQPWQ